MAAAAGLTELLTASHAAYETVRIAGVRYLSWLGCGALWRSRRRRGPEVPAAVFRTAMLLTLIDVAELLIWFCVLSVAAAALAERINRASFRRAMERISGLVFLGFAVNLAVDRP